MASLRSNYLPLALALLVAACSSDPPLGPPQREIIGAPSFASDINEIFQRRGCSAGICHGAPSGQAGLMLTASAAANYAMLVDVDAASENFKRVLPNDANNSYIVIKLEGRQTVGSQMPLSQTPLDNIDLTL